MEWEPDVPRWRQVYAILEERIADGTYPPGSQIPGVLAIQQEFGIAQMTARRVLTELRAAGLAQMQPGVGTFVTELPKRPQA
ncbi:winged helix-turn-helix domain-containing protein [Streptomyces sp. ME02-6978a]|uniref:winged helix-turn-helix domain-containing protein n=1 Tax=unclassified Streptomyces TaxID=2593676 RepID=UPI0029ABE911|nr:MULTISPECIES: winged helix-turn-helix domain-containing protein [unclassified Streptomyces]MDX3087206.1 winged helix-turn-helix domain-containing protein [Streptomyces sp. ME12-02E]MDX3335848.1 winged helix-turn-helix domain-containing protein [Streptomyces sp. ME02-6978a]